MSSDTLLKCREYHLWRFKRATMFAISVSRGLDYASYGIPPDIDEDPTITDTSPNNYPPSRPYIPPPPGFDHICLESLLNLPRDDLSTISSLFQTCMSDGFIAEPWKTSHVICISNDDFFDKNKQGSVTYDLKTEDPHQFDSFHFVFLHSSAYRIFSSMVTKKVARCLRDKLCVSNRGFFPCNTIPAARRRCKEVFDVLSFLKSQRQSFACGLVDLGIGYGCILHQHLKIMIRNNLFGIPPNLQKLCVDSIQGRNVVFHGPEGPVDDSSPVPLTRGLGLIGGDPLHRLLFTMILDPLLQFCYKCRPRFGLTYKNTHFDLMIFCGQLIMIAPDVKELKRLVKQTLDYTQSMGIVVQPQDFFLFCV
ncbi:hypothetical protein GEMRC1_003494 [Eukaryota sp. GEM-RC1]